MTPSLPLECVLLLRGHYDADKFLDVSGCARVGGHKFSGRVRAGLTGIFFGCILAGYQLMRFYDGKEN
jgi:hypothetical protein